MQAYHQLVPFKYEREDLEHAELMTLLSVANGNKQAKVKHFIHDWFKVRVGKAQSEEVIKQKILTGFKDIKIVKREPNGGKDGDSNK